MNRIDLHGTKHADVQQKLDQFYWEAMQRGHFEVEVVTGISERMKQIVREVSKDYNFRIEEIPLNPGSLTVRIK
jgi:DNA-nicking Smr family endonuclease